LLFVPLYTYIFVYEFDFGDITGTQYMICFLKKEHICKMILRKKLTKKKLWSFEWPKMSHIYGIIWVDFNFYFFSMYIKKLFRMTYFHMDILVH
jgi:hypothetical protein